MEKFSGLVLDFYDDPNGSVLKEVYASADSLPELVKQAHALTSDEISRLPDDAFALVMTQNGQELKKFATVDAGNTVLSVAYFLKTASRLPVEAQKIAATNLVSACGWYGLECPEQLSKLALSAEKIKNTLDGAPFREDMLPLKSASDKEKEAGLLGAAITATAVPGAVRESRNNMRATQGAGGMIMTPQQIQQRKMQGGF